MGMLIIKMSLESGGLINIFLCRNYFSKVKAGLELLMISFE